MAQNNWLDEGSTPVPKPTSAAADTSWLDEQSDVVQDNALVRGIKKTSQSIGITKGLLTGDSADTARKVAEATDYARKNPGMQEGKEIGAAWERGDGISGGISEVAGEFAKDWREAPGVIKGLRATGRNLRAMGEKVIEQVPNMAAPVIGMVGGGAAGSAAAGPVGTVLGGWAGASAGNTLVEGGGMVQEALQKAGINPQDTAAVEKYLTEHGDTILGQSATKGAIIGAVDTLTAGLGGRLLNAPARAAASRALGEMGVNVADKAAVKAAMNTPEFKAEFKAKIASDATYQASKKGAGNIARNVGAAALDPAGEFTGEFVGQGVATGEWDTKNAALEAFSSIGQSGTMFAGQKAYQRFTRPGETEAHAPAPPAVPPAPGQPPQPGPVLGLPAPDRGVIKVAGDGTARTPAYQTPGYVGDVTDVEPKAPTVRDQVAVAAAQGGALSPAALTAIDTGAAAAVQPAEPKAEQPAPISLEEADARDQAAYEQFYASADSDPVVGRYFENDDDIPDFDAASNVSDEEFLRSLGATDEDIQDAIATASQPAIPQSRPAVDAGAQANEPAGPRQGAAAAQADQGQVAPRQPSNFSATPAATMGQPGATARPGPGFGLKDALAQIRVKKQEAANAQGATPETAPSSTPVPAAGTGAVEAAGPASIPATIGANSEPTSPQAIQAGTQPAQAAAAPAAGPAPANTAAPATAGASTVRALSDAPTPQNIGAQGAPAGGTQGNAQTPDQIRRARLEREISTGKTNNGGVIASLRPSAIEKRKQELDAMGERGRILDAQGKAPRATAEQLTGAQERWQRMTTAERQAVAARTDVKPILRKNLHGAKWENLNVDVQRKLQAAMEPIEAQPSDMKAFKPETGTLGVPRSEMPQVPSQSHGGLVKHLNSQGISHKTTTVDAGSLKPTQAEYSPAKVEAAKGAEGGRAVIVSNDGHIIDGHHQAMAAAEDGKPVKAIVLDAPVEQALEAVKNSPSAQNNDRNQAPALDAKAPEAIKKVAEQAAPKPDSTVTTMRSLAQQFRDRHAVTKKDTDRTFAGVLDQFAQDVEQGKRTPQSVQQAIERYQELAAEPFQATQTAPATHADPGQAPEVATPAVVAQSVQKAARNEDTKPSEMRKWLVGKIDEAIAVAPEAAVDFLSFDVPGDGTFKVQNSQARLQEFRKKVMASPGFKDGGQRQNTQPPEQTDSARNGSGSTVEAIRNFLADGDVQSAVEFAKLKGVEFTPVEPRASMTANGKFKRVPASVKSSVPSVAEGLTQVEAEQLNQYLTAENAIAEQNALQSPQDGNQAYSDGQQLGADDLLAYFDQVIAGSQKGEKIVNPRFQIGAVDAGTAQEIANYIDGYDGQQRNLRVSGRTLKHIHESRPAIAREIVGQLPGMFSKPDEVLPDPKHKNKRALLVKERQTEEGQSKPKSYVATVEVEIEIEVKDGFIDIVTIMTAPERSLKEARELKKNWPEGQQRTEQAVNSPHPLTAEAANPAADSPDARPAGVSVPPTGTTPQPITRADVAAAQQQAAAIITERIDAMTAGEVNTIARRFLPTMGVKPTVSKERNKAAVTDFTKVNPMAAATEFGATLPTDVRRVLQADMEGRVADAGQDDAVNPRVPRENRAPAKAPTQGEQKEPWQMTALEFGQQENGNPHWNQSYAGKDDGAYLADTAATHALLVRDAVAAGKLPESAKAESNASAAPQTDTGNVAMFSRTGAQSANANKSTSRAWYDRFVSLLPESYRNDPHRREPLPAEDWNVQRATEVRGKVESLNKQLRGENDRKGYGPISIDGLGNLQVSALDVSVDDLDGPIKALANELGAGIAVTKVRAAGIQALRRKGFVAEISLAPVADRIMGREFVTPANAYATDAGAQGAIMTYKPRGFPAVLFARDTATPTADSNARNVATQMLVDGLKAKWTRAPEIIVARNMQDPQVPQAVRDYDETLKSQGATGEPRGFIYKGKVYLLSDQLKGPQQIAEVLFHEVLGHYGLRGAFGESLTPILQQMGTMRRRDVVAKAREYGLFDKDALGGLDKAAASDRQIWDAMSAKNRLSAAEEVLAEMAQTQPNIGFVQRTIAAIRNWLRANVPGFKSLRLTDADIIQAYILPARGFVTRSNETAQQAIDRAMAAFSRDTNTGMATNDVVGNQGGRSADDISPGASFDAQAAFEKHGGTGDIDESTDITAKSQAFADMAEAEGYTVIGRGDKYVTIKKSFGQDADGYAKTAIIKVRISDHSNVNRSNHFGETDINIAPDDGYSRDTFADALRKIQSAYVNDDLDTVIPSEPTASGLSDAANPDIRFSRTTAASIASSMGELTPDQEQAYKNVAGVKAVPTVRERMDALKANLGLKLRQGLVDQFAAIKQLDQNAYVQARMSKGTDGTLEAILMYGKPFMREGAPDVDIKDGGFAKVLASLKGEQDRWMMWIAAQRAEKLKAEGKENLMTDDDISALKTLNAGRMADGTARTPVYAKALAELNEYNDAMLKLAMDSGLIDQAAYDLMTGQPYVPFYRLMEDGDMKGPKFSSGLTNQKAWQKLKGGTQQLNADLLQNMLLNWSHLLQASAKNRAATATMDAAEKMAVAYKVDADTKGSVKVMRDGSAEHWMVEDPYLLDAISAIHYVPSPLMKPLAKFKQLLTWGVTVNPTFKIRNLIRDSVSAIAQSELGYNPAANVAKGWKLTAKDSQIYASMLASGGLIKFGTQENTDRLRAQVAKLGGVVLDKGGAERFFGQIKDLYDVYNEFGDRAENVNRAALYDALIKKGKTHAEAAFMARDLMDFSMGGSAPVVRFLTQAVPFLNARLVGLDKLGRAAMEDPRRFAAVTGAVALASLALMAGYSDDEDWKKREDWDRDAYWWFKIGGQAYRIPKPFEVGAIGTLAERTAELMLSDEMTGKRYMERVSHMLSGTFSFNPVPQAFKPLLDLYANKDSFTGRAIESQADQRLRPGDRYSERTPEVAKFLGGLGLPDPAQLVKGEYSALSPKQVEHLIRGYFSWVGTAAMTVSDFGLRPLAGRGERPDMRLKDVFIAGNFVENLPTGSSRYVTQMYEQSRQVEQAYASYQEAIKAGDMEKAQSIKESAGPLLRNRPAYTAATRQLAEINRTAKRIEADQAMAGADKRARLTQLEQQRQVIAQRVSRLAAATP